MLLNEDHSMHCDIMICTYNTITPHDPLSHYNELPKQYHHSLWCHNKLWKIQIVIIGVISTKRAFIQLSVTCYTEYTQLTVTWYAVTHNCLLLVMQGIHSCLLLAMQGTHIYLLLTMQGTHSCLLLAMQGTHSWLLLTMQGTHSWLLLTMQGTHSWQLLAMQGTHSWLLLTMQATHSWLLLACRVHTADCYSLYSYTKRSVQLISIRDQGCRDDVTLNNNVI